MQLTLVISYLTAVNGERKEEKKLFSENPIGFLLFCIAGKRIFRLFILTNPRAHDHCARTQIAAKRTKTVAAARPCQNARQTSAQQHKLWAVLHRLIFIHGSAEHERVSAGANITGVAAFHVIIYGESFCITKIDLSISQHQHQQLAQLYKSITYSLHV
jgi:hypothetical protein